MSPPGAGEPPTLLGSAVSALDKHLAPLHTVRLMKERVAADRLGGLLVGAPDEAAERALMGIVLDAFSQGEELEEILVAWREEASPAPKAPEEGASEVPFDALLESLIEAKREAAEVYRAAAADCPRRDLAERLARLAAEDHGHAQVLSEIARRGRPA